MFCSRTTFDQRSISSRISFAYASGALPITSKPRSCSLSRTAGVASAFTSVAFSFCTTAGSMPAGPSTP